MSTNPKILYSTQAIHSHAQQIALAMYERDWLAEWQTQGLDVYKSSYLLHFRQKIKYWLPGLANQMLKRSLNVDIPLQLIQNDLGWDVPFTALKKIRQLKLVEDWYWEQNELYKDRLSAKKMRNKSFNVFIGTEFGSLQAIRSARKEGKKSIVIFTSPHYQTRHRWLDEEYSKYPNAVSVYSRKIRAKEYYRNRRTDEEAFEADFIHTNSQFSSQSLIEIGIPKEKIGTVLLGGPIPVAKEIVDVLQLDLRKPLRVMYAGPLSIRKGAHILIKVWKELNLKNAELHFYGSNQLDKGFFESIPNSIIFHGSVGTKELYQAYLSSDVLFFPTLCDGFGLVVTEALSNACPVITTTNAGAADYIIPNQNGFVIPPADEHVISEKLLWCVENREKLFLMKTTAWELSHNNTWGKFRAQFSADLKKWLL